MNEYLKAWDKYVQDGDGTFTEDERIAFKNGWVYAVDLLVNSGRSLWNDAVFVERTKDV